MSGNTFGSLFRITTFGEYQHSFDDKSRISLPAKFRKEMGKKVIIAPGIDNCLFVFTVKGWKEFTDRLSNSTSTSVLQTDNRNFNRLIIGRAAEVDVDGVGRMLVPEHLRLHAGLTVKSTIIGIVNRVEIWDSATWETYRNEFGKKTDNIAEKLISAGII
jgi:MraZ protein